jgi:hypothetical protein
VGGKRERPSALKALEEALNAAQAALRASEEKWNCSSTLSTPPPVHAILTSFPGIIVSFKQYNGLAIFLLIESFVILAR